MGPYLLLGYPLGERRITAPISGRKNPVVEIWGDGVPGWQLEAQTLSELDKGASEE